jgi:hypothetical protein
MAIKHLLFSGHSEQEKYQKDVYLYREELQINMKNFSPSLLPY